MISELFRAAISKILQQCEFEKERNAADSIYIKVDEMNTWPVGRHLTH